VKISWKKSIHLEGKKEIGWGRYDELCMNVMFFLSVLLERSFFLFVSFHSFCLLWDISHRDRSERCCWVRSETSTGKGRGGSYDVKYIFSRSWAQVFRSCIIKLDVSEDSPIFERRFFFGVSLLSLRRKFLKVMRCVSTFDTSHPASLIGQGRSLWPRKHIWPYSLNRYNDLNK
jgi:hypothetical protein